MGTVIVVIHPPDLTQLPHLLHGVKDVSIQYSSAISPVKSLHIAILTGLTRLNKEYLDPMPRCPLAKRLGNEFSPISL